MKQDAEISIYPPPWQRIAVDAPGPEFEARPPGMYAFDIPDTECDGWSTPELTLRSATVRGAKHRYYRQPRQDAARAAAHESAGAIAFAVADGVSSATQSELGALEACRASVEMLLELLGRGVGPLDLRAVATHAAVRLYELARWQLQEVRPDPGTVASLYATTLVTGVVRPDPGGPIVELCRIGDSGAWILDRARGSYKPLFQTKTGAGVDVVSNEVNPLPTVPAALEQARGRLAADAILLIGSDGFGDPLGDGDGQVGSLFARELDQPPPPGWFAHVLDFSRETFDDDRTLLAVWPRAAWEVR